MHIVDLARRWLDAVGARDVDGELELWAADGVLEFPFAQPPAPRTLAAGEPLRQFRTAVSRLVPRLQWRDVEVYELNVPDRLWITARSEATAVNGRPFGGDYALLFGVTADGHFARIQEYADPTMPSRTFTPDELLTVRPSDGS